MAEKINDRGPEGDMSGTTIYLAWNHAEDMWSPCEDPTDANDNGGLRVIEVYVKNDWSPNGPTTER